MRKTIEKISFLMALSMIFSAIFCNIYCQKARVMIEPVKITLDALPDTFDIEHLDDNSKVTAGYLPVARGEFKPGPVTVNCGERLMIKRTEEKARAIGATAFSFYDVKEPNFVLNSCYRAKILFLKKE